MLRHDALLFKILFCLLFQCVLRRDKERDCSGLVSLIAVLIIGRDSERPFVTMSGSISSISDQGFNIDDLQQASHCIEVQSSWLRQSINGVS
ncbi:hypothetical protein GWI33_008958 [Rhynchophorus ferrugineus]|uniref:Secreted protein n=1 Tax=Rhynchophorus ferrugineus TaxID=354439 RepID=A0A834MGZ0_RHYFE|nr:hypothetical protein GWI33_008958 [Rhynchophorus ferrugineus]